MKSLTVKQIISATRGELMGEMPDLLDIVITGINTDTRTIKGGQLFIPLVGENFDGHYFLDEAAKKGASAVLIHRKDGEWFTQLFPGIAAIKVKDTLRALQDLAFFQRSRFQIPIIAITGSNGKTTTKDMIALVLSQKYNTLKTEGNLNNEVGLPLTLLRLDDGHKAAVIEMGMSNLGEIRRLSEIARPTMALITNIGVSHLGNLGTRDNILKAKMEVLDLLGAEDMAILNGDDEYLGNIKQTFPFEIKYYGTNESCHIKAENIKDLGGKGTAYDLVTDEGIYPVKIPVPGRHNVYNSLGAIATGIQMGMEIGDIVGALQTFHPGAMRLNIFSTDSGLQIIDDVYNASPDSMKAAIEVLKDLNSKRRIAILGDMLELGSYSKKGHIEVGETVAARGIDILITVGSESKFIGMGAQDFGMEKENIIHLDCNKDVIRMLNTMVDMGDTILVKGSRGIKMEEIVGHLKKWNGVAGRGKNNG